MNTAQPLKFLLVGAGGYVVNLAVFAIRDRAGVPYVTASIGAYFVANALMYLGNRYFTFGLGHDDFWATYLRYFMAGAVIAGLNALVLTLLVEIAGLSPTVGLAVSLLLITPAAFMLNKRWTFQLRTI